MTGVQTCALPIWQLDANFRRGTRLAGVEGRFHDSRRTALSRLAKRFTVMELAKISGHKDINILFKHYYQVSVEDLAEKMNG